MGSIIIHILDERADTLLANSSLTSLPFPEQVRAAASQSLVLAWTTRETRKTRYSLSMGEKTLGALKR